MEEQLPYYEDRQQEAWEDYERLVKERDALHLTIFKQEADFNTLRSRIAELEAAASKVCLCRMNYSKRGVLPALEEYQAMMQSITELAIVLEATLRREGSNG